MRSAQAFGGVRQHGADAAVHRHGRCIGYPTVSDDDTIGLGQGRANVVEGGCKPVQVFPLFGTDIDQQPDMGWHDIGGIGQHRELADGRGEMPGLTRKVGRQLFDGEDEFVMQVAFAVEPDGDIRVYRY